MTRSALAQTALVAAALLITVPSVAVAEVCAVFDQFGRQVAIDGDIAVIGAANDDEFSGSAYVFVRSSGVWSQQAKLLPSDGGSFDERFGFSVAVSGKLVD